MNGELTMADSRSALEEAAECCLRGSSYLALHNISCHVRNGVLVLRGRLPSYYLKQLAQEAVARLKEVQHIANQIEVVTPVIRSRRD